MKTRGMLIAILIVTGFACSLLHAQMMPTRGFGMGLFHADSGEEIFSIARESPLHDIGIVVGDRIVEVDGQPIAGNDVVLGGQLGGTSESVAVIIRRKSNGMTFSAMINKSMLRKAKGERCGMMDKTTAYVRPQSFNSDSVEVLEAMLDSLARGSDGHGTVADTVLMRADEARSYLYRQNPQWIPMTNEDIAAYKAQINGYIEDKYGWKMETLILDLRGSIREFSPEVLRSIRLFCEEHHLVLVREI